jgi:hypothetical protein
MLSLRGWSAWRGAPVFAVLALGAFVLSLYVSGPGWMAIDSGNQLDQARSFQFRDDHPVLMALLWHYTDLVLPGPFGMLLPMTAWHWAGLAGVFWALPGPLAARALGMLCVGFYPPVFSNVPVVWKDTLMQAALVMSLACFAFDGRRAGVVAGACGVVFASIAIGARHNAVAAVWPLLAIPLLRSRLLAGKTRWFRFAMALGGALALTVVLAVGLRRTLAPLALATDFWQFLPAFDLAGMSVESGENLIEPDTGLLTPGMGLDHVRHFYNPEYMNPLYYCMGFQGRRCVHVFNRTHDRQKLDRLSQNWRQMILEHPGAYLKHRWHVSSALLAVRGGARGIYYVDRAPFNQFGSDYPPPPRTLKILSWIESKVRQLWFRPWLYFVIGAAFIPLAFIGYLRGASPVPVLYALSGFLYMGSLFVGAGSSDYRYTVWTTLSTLLALIVAAAPVLDRAWQRRAVARDQVAIGARPNMSS